MVNRTSRSTRVDSAHIPRCTREGRRSVGYGPSAGGRATDPSQEEGVLRWLRVGNIVYDPTGVLERASVVARAAPSALPGELAIYQAWWGINYNVVQMCRYLASSDPRSRHAASLRFLYSLMDIASHFFTVRQIPWDGENAAIKYWTEYDVGFWNCLQQALREPDLDRKRELYEALAQMTLAPVRGLWPANTTSVWLGWGWGTGQEFREDSAMDGAARVLSFWHEFSEA